MIRRNAAVSLALGLAAAVAVFVLAQMVREREETLARIEKAIAASRGFRRGAAHGMDLSQPARARGG